MNSEPRPALFLGLALLFTGAVFGDLLMTTASHPDGRTPVGDLYQTWESLAERGWAFEVIWDSRPAGVVQSLPIIALKSPRAGPAAWFLAGIHGEEPAGPMALAQSVEALAALGERMPVVILPLLNPHGYTRNWRYLNRADWAKGATVQSVGDSAHVLPDPEYAGQARADAASSPEAAAISAFITKTASDYPPRYSIDLHEDNLLEAGYVYSQGLLGEADPLAHQAVAVLRDTDVAVEMEGETRFGEAIHGGIIGPVTDSSIDELMSAPGIILEGIPAPGPSAKTVLVFETPAKTLALSQRVAAHGMLIERLSLLMASVQDQ